MESMDILREFVDFTVCWCPCIISFVHCVCTVGWFKLYVIETKDFLCDPSKVCLICHTWEMQRAYACKNIS